MKEVSIYHSCRGEAHGKTHLCQVLLHDLGAVVDSEDNIGDASSSKGLDLVLNHGLVRELDQGLGEGEGLRIGINRSVKCSISAEGIAAAGRNLLLLYAAFSSEGEK